MVSDKRDASWLIVFVHFMVLMELLLISLLAFRAEDPPLGFPCKVKFFFSY